MDDRTVAGNGRMQMQQHAAVSFAKAKHAAREGQTEIQAALEASTDALQRMVDKQRRQLDRLKGLDDGVDDTGAAKGRPISIPIMSQLDEMSGLLAELEKLQTRACELV
ncbi:MAG: hypothetical protein ACRYG8_23390 [Janthinobacterium lividum]